MKSKTIWWLTALGALSLLPYLYAFQLQDLRRNTVQFEIAFFLAFVLYAIAVGLLLARPPTSLVTRHLALIFGFAILFRAVLIFTPPTLSDDMYRYVWDGRVQAQGNSPYAYPPIADQLKPLRDDAIWPHINRQDAITVYPAGAEVAYAAIWRIVPDNVRWFQIVMVAGDLLAGVLLLKLLRAFQRPASVVLIYLWSPLVIFEIAHSGHVDALVLPVLIAAWLARVKGRDGLVGVLVGAATALKIYPAILLPALWRPRDEAGRWRSAWKMPLAFAMTLALPYVPYLAKGTGVVGYLPNYFDERFNTGVAGLVTRLIDSSPVPKPEAVHAANAVLALALVALGVTFIIRPVQKAEDALRRCAWLIGAFTLLTQNLFPWYLIWLVPLVALFFRAPGVNGWTGWFLFGGLIALAYTFFIAWKPVLWTAWVEFVPLYAFLILPVAWRLMHARLPSRLVTSHETSAQT